MLIMEKRTFLIFLLYISSLFQAPWGFILGIDSTQNKYRCPDSVAHGKYLYTFREKCYEFVIYQEKYWKDARADCVRKGGDLVVVDDASIQIFLVNTLTSMGKTKEGIWLGLTDSRHELHWEWVNGEPLQGYSNWAHSQGGANFLHLTQDCAQIQMKDNGLWHDRECHLWPNKYSYICEYDMSRLTTTSSTVSKLPVTSKLSTTVSSLPKSTSSKLSITETLLQNSTSSKLSSTETLLPKSTSSKVSSTETLFPKSTSSKVSTTETLLPESTSSKLSTMETLLRLSTRIMATRMSTATNAVTKTTSRTLVNSSQVPNIVTTEKTIICSELNCALSCPLGYSGVYVGLDGCINCRCN